MGILGEKVPSSTGKTVTGGIPLLRNGVRRFSTGERFEHGGLSFALLFSRSFCFGKDVEPPAREWDPFLRNVVFSPSQGVVVICSDGFFASGRGGFSCSL
jgi:hypothetical protein